MIQRYEILTTIRYRHDFFQSSPWQGISLRVPVAAGKQLLDADLVLKQQQTGCTLLYNTLGAGKRDRADILQDNITLTFEVVLNDPLFYNYTGIRAEHISSRCFVFGNAGRNTSGMLHRQAYADVADLQAVDTPPGVAAKPFGVLSLELNASLQENYEIRFPAQSTYWCYFLMSGQLSSLAHPVILDTNGVPCFSAPVLTTMPDMQQVPVLISNQPIPLSDRTTNFLKLADQYPDEKDKHKVIISPLPTPDPGRISAAGRAWHTIDKTYSEIFLY
ncbi:hypothetical protein ACTJJ0_33760 [Chitinophaga sp. 22321]|uniref:Urease accessory protein UreD n=1 Tax=Chitinophaga hostae TaxID=2831022 RepID=A0ABS5JAP9_9BACT|nr:hypothetical protein [Chitinophaga hostae]MBS0032287.1 hypothetical protein [Chitinophaga hostae]